MHGATSHKPVTITTAIIITQPTTRSDTEAITTTPRRDIIICKADFINIEHNASNDLYLGTHCKAAIEASTFGMEYAIGNEVYETYTGIVNEIDTINAGPKEKIGISQSSYFALGYTVRIEFNFAYFFDNIDSVLHK